MSNKKNKFKLKEKPVAPVRSLITRSERLHWEGITLKDALTQLETYKHLDNAHIQLISDYDYDYSRPELSIEWQELEPEDVYQKCHNKYLAALVVYEKWSLDNAKEILAYHEEVKRKKEEAELENKQVLLKRLRKSLINDQALLNKLVNEIEATIPDKDLEK